jgi:hypothetical protein
MVGDPLPTAFHHSIARRVFHNNQLEKQTIMRACGCEGLRGEQAGRRRAALPACMSLACISPNESSTEGCLAAVSSDRNMPVYVNISRQR